MGPSFTEAFWKAKTIGLLDLPDYACKVGWTDHHRVRKPYDPAIPFPANLEELSKQIVDTLHATTVYCHAFLNPALFNLYTIERQLGGKSDINWAYRPTHYWTFCEECEALWVTERQPRFFTIIEIFPANYFPEPQIINSLISGNYFHLLQDERLVLWNTGERPR